MTVATREHAVTSVLESLAIVESPSVRVTNCSIAGEAMPFLRKYGKAAMAARKAWMRMEGQAAIDACAGKPKLLASVMVPVFDFQKAGLIAAAENLKQLSILNRKEHRVQTISSFPRLYANAHSLSPRFNDFLRLLAQKCAGAKVLQAPLKGPILSYYSSRPQ